MKIDTLNSRFAVTGQIGPADVADVVRRGFRSVICARPDGEAEDQPTAHAVATSAKAVGLSFGSVPLDTAKVSTEALAEFSAIVDNLAAPILVYCRSGGRARALCETFGQKNK